MHVGILGTGTMAAAVGEGWIRAGHRLSIGGRSDRKAGLLADRLGPASRAVTPEVVACESDAVLLAVAWEGVEEMLRLAGAPQQSLEGKTLIDCTNAVDYRTFALKPSNGSAAGTIAELAPGAHIVKALHLFAGQSWLSPPPSDVPRRTVAMCGDDAAALEITADLVRELGGAPAVVGGLEAARQLEDVAGFVMRLVAAGFDPATAVPIVQPTNTR